MTDEERDRAWIDCFVSLMNAARDSADKMALEILEKAYLPGAQQEEPKDRP